jgi:hypothetical protein
MPSGANDGAHGRLQGVFASRSGLPRLPDGGSYLILCGKAPGRATDVPSTGTALAPLDHRGPECPTRIP